MTRVVSILLTRPMIPRPKNQRAQVGSDSMKRPAPARKPTTLAIDIGGTGLKAMLLDPKGTPISERVRIETPRPATPDAVVEKLVDLVRPLRDFDRVSVGFPGVVVDGRTLSAPNLDGDWS